MKAINKGNMCYLNMTLARFETGEELDVRVLTNVGFDETDEKGVPKEVLLDTTTLNQVAHFGVKIGTITSEGLPMRAVERKLKHTIKEFPNLILETSYKKEDE